MRYFAFVLFLLALCLSATGCALRESGKKLMRARDGHKPEVAAARQPGKYNIAYLLAGTRHLVHLPGTQVVIARGQPLGFKRSDSGGLVAIAGHKQITIDHPSMLAEYYCWYQRPRHDFVRDVQRFTNDSFEVAGTLVATAAVVTAGAALIGGAVFLDAYLDKLGGGDDDDGSFSDLDRQLNENANHSHHDDSGNDKHRKKKKK